MPKYNDFFSLKRLAEERYPNESRWFHTVYAQEYNKLKNMSRRYDIEYLTLYIEMSAWSKRSPGRRAALKEFLEDFKNSQENT